MLKDYDDVIVAVQQPDGEKVCMCMDHHILTTKSLFSCCKHVYHYTMCVHAYVLKVINTC